jgi:hypothetical protein
MQQPQQHRPPVPNNSMNPPPYPRNPQQQQVPPSQQQPNSHYGGYSQPQQPGGATMVGMGQAMGMSGPSGQQPMRGKSALSSINCKYVVAGDGRVCCDFEARLWRNEPAPRTPSLMINAEFVPV